MGPPFVDGCPIPAENLNRLATTSINVQNYLPSGQPDGTTDNSPAIQAMIDAVCSRSPPGGDIHFVAATYVVHDVNINCSGIHLVGIASPDATVVDYSLATDHGLKFAPNGFPAITPSQWLYGNGVENITFRSSGGKTRALDFDGFNSGYINRISFSGSIYNGIRLYGGYGFDIENTLSSGYAGAVFTNMVIDLEGDLTGRNNSGDACILATCSTRTDFVKIGNLSSYGTSGTGLNIQGLVATVYGEHIALNVQNYGLVVSCRVDFPSIAYCPSFISFTDLETEGALTFPIYMTDFTDFQCVGCYAFGSGANLNVLYANLANFSQNSSFGGGFRWKGGRLGAAQQMCVKLGVSDTKIDDAWIYNCNKSSDGYAGTEYFAGTQHSESNNTYCTVLGGVTSPSMAGSVVTDPASKATFNTNSYWGCSSGVTTNGSPTNVNVYNSQGP